MLLIQSSHSPECLQSISIWLVCDRRVDYRETQNPAGTFLPGRSAPSCMGVKTPLAHSRRGTTSEYKIKVLHIKKLDDNRVYMVGQHRLTVLSLVHLNYGLYRGVAGGGMGLQGILSMGLLQNLLDDDIQS